VFPIAPHLIPYAFGKCCPFRYIGGPKGGSPYTKREPSIFGKLHSLSFYFVIGSLQKGKLKLSESPPLNQYNELKVRDMVYVPHKPSRQLLKLGDKLQNYVDRVLHQCWFTLDHYLSPGPNQSTTHYLVRGCEGGPWKAKE
jgi:hypothetical protein